MDPLLFALLLLRNRLRAHLRLYLTVGCLEVLKWLRAAQFPFKINLNFYNNN
jgi:hypothetical protein